jgi:hypothetical protein
MEVDGIVKLRPLYASRRGVPGAALRPWVWFYAGLYNQWFDVGDRKPANVPMEGVKF